ncbi:MAG: mechanosensitive ion channel [Prevotella sp.]|nr:mechanosensitive ion channel [Prevotella sp.]
MEKVKIAIESLIGWMGLSGEYVPAVRYAILVVLAFVLAWLAGWLCRTFVVPVLLKITNKTDVKWDDVIFNRKVLLSACRIIPAIVIWLLLPLVFFEYPKVEEIVGRLTAIYFTIMTVRTIIVFIDSFKQLESGQRSSRQQYLYSVCGVLKILMIFISVIVVIAIIINKNPATLFAGLGAASAILMLAFQDTIKGLVAGIRLTANDMLHIGDWITVPSAGANGKVEEIALTMVKVRNFDNTIVTLSPQSLVDGSFQNWQGMIENEGRKQVRRVYYDYSSIVTEKPEIPEDQDPQEKAPLATTNITRFRQDIEQWLTQHPRTIDSRPSLVKQADTPQATGCCLEFIFWLKSQDIISYEHDTSDIMEYIYAAGAEYGLKVYQPAVS